MELWYKGEPKMMRNKSFDKMAALYDKIRASYPEQLIEDLISKAQITS